MDELSGKINLENSLTHRHPFVRLLGGRRRLHGGAESANEGANISIGRRLPPLASKCHRRATSKAGPKSLTQSAASAGEEAAAALLAGTSV
jgi:hypothetical protein